jgi:ribulose-phosphate 3-epimerase
MSILLAPSILSADFSRLGEQLSSLEKAGADRVHVDVMDGHFVPNLTFGPFILPVIQKSCSLPIDVHLMITNPDEQISSFASVEQT